MKTVKSLLFDLRTAIGDIATFTNGMDFDAYVADVKTQRAVEREFEILGEALNRLGRAFPEQLEQISEHRKISGFCNTVAHCYDEIDEVVIWRTIKEDLEQLEADIDRMEGGLEGETSSRPTA